MGVWQCSEASYQLVQNIVKLCPLPDTFQFWHFPILTLSNSDTFQFWHFPILTLSNSDTFQFWHFPIMTLSNYDTFQFWHFPILALSNSDIFQFWHFPILTLSDSDTFQFLPKRAKIGFFHFPIPQFFGIFYIGWDSLKAIICKISRRAG